MHHLIRVFGFAGLFAAFFGIACESLYAIGELILAKDGKSEFTIVIPADSPASVRNAALELQKDIELASGAKLPVEEDGSALRPPFISLGNTLQARTAGIDSETLPDEAFRIVTREGNLFILGSDTPDKGWTKGNGVSNGTANGVYVFLEDELDVRWLMPGDLGRDVPRKAVLTIKDSDRTHAPLFSIRHIGLLSDYANADQRRSIQEWTQFQRLGGATRLHYDHNLWQTVNNDRWNGRVDTPAVAALYRAHPEWFAMDRAGTRPYPQSDKAKVETTNPDFVRWFADRAIEYLKAQERPGTFSLSLSDGSGWSESPESKALYDPSPSNLYDPEAPAGAPGMSSLVLKWYHDVAQIVAREYPQGRLAGYIYASYVYPPTKVDMKLPDNFIPVICGIGTYGYGLYREDNRQRWKEVMTAWTKVAPKDWFYYDLPNQFLRQHDYEIGGANFPGTTGIVTTAAPDILDTIFPQLLQSHIKGAFLYGMPSWSNASLANYLLARMLWDPTLKAEEVQREWLHRAYGPEAGAVMEEFYAKLNGWTREFYQKVTKSGNLLSRAMLEGIYARNYSEMERILLKAKAKPLTSVQQQRLQLIEDNLVVLQWRLRNAGLLPASTASALQRDDQQINVLLTKENAGFPLFPGAVVTERVHWTKPKPLPWKVQLADSENARKETGGMDKLEGLEEGSFLIYAARAGDIRITPELATHGAYFAAYEISNEAGEMVGSGILARDVPVRFAAKSGEPYLLRLAPRNTVNYRLRVDDAVAGSGSLDDGVLTISGPSSPVYVLHVPDETPVGIFEENQTVVVKKPFSGNIGKAIMERTNRDVRVLHSLDEGWRFSPDPEGNGLRRGVTGDDFDDSSWREISPLNWWQMQGFADYHGVGWYRTKFTAAPLKENERARLFFGAVDGNAIVYLNGEKIAEHRVGPPESGYKGWDQPFSANVASKLRAGENTLVVQVTSKSKTTASGIIKGVAIVAGTRK